MMGDFLKIYYVMVATTSMILLDFSRSQKNHRKIELYSHQKGLVSRKGSTISKNPYYEK